MLPILLILYVSNKASMAIRYKINWFLELLENFHWNGSLRCDIAGSLQMQNGLKLFRAINRNKLIWYIYNFSLWWYFYFILAYLSFHDFPRDLPTRTFHAQVDMMVFSDFNNFGPSTGILNSLNRISSDSKSWSLYKSEDGDSKKSFDS